MHHQKSLRCALAVAVTSAAMSTLVACGSQGPAERRDAATPVFAPGVAPATDLSEEEAESLFGPTIVATSPIHAVMSYRTTRDGVRVDVTSEGDYQKNPDGFRTTMTIEKGNTRTVVELLAVGRSAYMRMEGDEQWIGVDKELGERYWSYVRSPFDEILALQVVATHDKATYRGHEEVNGVECAHYSFGHGESANARDMSFDAWFDAEGRLVRGRSVVGADLDLAFDFSKHGEKVTITEPKAEELAEGA